MPNPKQEEKKPSANKEAKFCTTSGISLKSFYSPEDVKINYQGDLQDPGEYPLTRGIFPSGYRQFAWQNAQISGYGLPEEANQRERYIRDKGASGYGGKDSI